MKFGIAVVFAIMNLFGGLQATSGHPGTGAAASDNATDPECSGTVTSVSQSNLKAIGVRVYARSLANSSNEGARVTFRLHLFADIIDAQRSEITRIEAEDPGNFVMTEASLGADARSDLPVTSEDEGPSVPSSDQIRHQLRGILSILPRERTWRPIKLKLEQYGSGHCFDRRVRDVPILIVLDRNVFG
jgi:hypothetical protein